MAVTPLRLKIVEVRAERPPRRQLEMRCHVENRGASAICILDAWLKISVFQDLHIAEGRLFYPEDNRVAPASIQAKATGQGIIVIELPPPVPQRIERRRAGPNDLLLGMRSRVRVSEVSAETTGHLLQVPFETCFTDGQGDYFEHRIPHSVWVRLLRDLEWSELELVEIPTMKLRTHPDMARALEFFAVAQECYRSGLWPDCVVNCRKVIEAMVKEVTGKDNMKEALKAIEALIGEGPKAVQLNDLLRSFNGFLHLARHPQLPPVEIQPNDATLVLHVTGAILSYLGTT
jgi:hypothetical protein